MSKQIGFPFRVCDLTLEVLCSGPLSKVVNSVIESFGCAGRVTKRLLLKHDENLRSGASVILSATHLSSGQLNVAVRDVDAYNVSAAIGIFLSLVLSTNRGILLHGAFLLDKGRAYLFLGRAGAGKSTIVSNAEGMRCVHDDKVAVRKYRNQWWAYGIPMLDNKGGIGVNLAAPVEGVYLIEKGSELKKSFLKKKTVLAELPEHVILPIDDTAIRANTFDNMMDWISDSQIWRLSFRKSSNVKLAVQ